MTKQIKLVPGGCLQFVDILLDFSEFDTRYKRYFYDCKSCMISLETPDNGDNLFDRVSGKLAVYPPDTGKPRHKAGSRIREASYGIKREEALEPFLDRWFPLPFFKMKADLAGEMVVERGPSNWVRGYLSKRIGRREEGDNASHSLTLVFDTQIEVSADQQEFHAIRPEDVELGAEFVFAPEENQCGWLLLKNWVDNWLLDLFSPYNKQLIKRDIPEDEKRYWEHTARYLTLLDILNQLDVIPRTQLIPLEERDVIPVDLVLDVGNSRTCGVLVEQLAEAKVMGLNDIFHNTYGLEIRDLSDPVKRYREPFESRVEFSLVNFGDPQQYSNSSGRRKTAFSWPSPVRIGPESLQLGLYSRSEQGRTGMSSPKRYLWDQYPPAQQWRFNSGTTKGEEMPVITGPYVLYINDYGTPLRPLENGEREILRDSELKKQLDNPDFLDPVTAPQFTRSSLMMFMLSEIIAQALVTINSPGLRERRPHPHMPRQLRRIVLTMPTAMTIAERKIFARWAEWAVEMVWHAMGWWSDLKELLLKHAAQRGESDEELDAIQEAQWWKDLDSLASAQDLEEQDMLGYRDYRIPPEISFECDEASATHLVYLTNEVIQKFRGDANSMFRLFGRRRKSMPDFDREVLRIASIDIGGGTTDLMITTYGERTDSAATVIHPHQEFGEGFNIAGDDILKAIIEHHVIRSLKKAVEESGVTESRNVLMEILGGDFDGLKQTERDRFLRYQFTSQIAVPIGLQILVQYEKFSPKEGNRILSMEFGSFFVPPNPPPEVISFIDTKIQKAGGRDFSLQRLTIELDMLAIDQTIRNTIDPIMGNLSEIVHLYDCDLLLLSGRPSRLPAVHSSILSKIPLPPNRIVLMHRYRVGDWYPFRDVSNHINDPKTTTAVGSVLNVFSEGYIERYRFDTRQLAPRSTCRFMGILGQDGYIAKQDVFFNQPLDLNGREEIELEQQVRFEAPLFIGFRQLESKRWPATPFYRLVYNDRQASEKAKFRYQLPFNITVKFSRKSKEEDAPLHTSIGDILDEGVITIEEVEDAAGNTISRNNFELRLQTLRAGDDIGHYWLDTGLLKIL